MSCLLLISVTCFFKIDTNPFLEPIIAGTPSAVTGRSFLKSSCIFDAPSRKSFKTSFPVILPLNGTNSISPPVMINYEFIPRTNITNCAVSLTSLLSTSATE